MSEGRDLVKEAVRDAKAVREAAVAAAKNEIVEGMAPQIRKMVDRAIGAAVAGESVDRSRVPGQGSDYYSAASRKARAKWEEGKDRGEETMEPMGDAKKRKDAEIDMESIASFFPQLAEEPDADEEGMPSLEDALDAGAGAVPGGGIPVLGEEPRGDDEEPPAEPEPEVEETMKIEARRKKDDEKEMVDEEIEIADAELQKVYESALKAEATVKKDFGDVSPGGELEDVVKDTGLLDSKKGEAGWEEVEPPAKQDYTVKEMIQRGLAENRALRAENGKLREAVGRLARQLHEVNLFNSKVLNVNRILNKCGRLTAEQRRVVLESIDAAESIDEVKKIYETLVRSFASSRRVDESRGPRRPAANAQRRRTGGEPDPKVISEAVERSGENKEFARMKYLAGLVS